MTNFKTFLYSAGLMAATTVGAGLFALPYVFSRSGWLLGLFYLAFLSSCLIFVHSLYFEVLKETGERRRLLGFMNQGQGALVRGLAFLVIVGGLLLALVAYIILAGEFIESIFPFWGFLGSALFWLLGSLPLVFRLRRLVASELLGGLLMLAVILVLLFWAPRGEVAPLTPALVWPEFFLPFGVTLFALAGWTAVEPIFDYAKKTVRTSFSPRLAMALGTGLAAVLYGLFALTILTRAPAIAPDTLGGLTSWPRPLFVSVILLGLLAIWTSYVPISLEIKNSLEKDLKWGASQSTLLVFLAPPALVIFGFRDFIKVVGLAGGLLLSLQYLFIILVGRRILSPSRLREVAVKIFMALFVLGALYEVYYFIIE